MNFGFVINAAAAAVNLGFWAHTGALSNLCLGIVSAVVAVWCFEL